MNITYSWLRFSVCVLVVGLCSFSAESRSLSLKQESGTHPQDVAEENSDLIADSRRLTESGAGDRVVGGVVTLLAGIKPPSALATCGMRPSYKNDQQWTKMNFARVVAGKTSNTRWPWQVALFNKTAKEAFCGGTLIGREHIITAAHCFDGKNQNDILIILGDHDRSKQEGTEQEFTIDCIHIHRRYVKGVPYNNDIALVKLKTSPGHDVIINDFVMPACMPEKNEFKPGDMCYVTGWGYTNFFDLLLGKKPQVLNEAEVPILSNSQCQQAYGNYISKKMICAGYLEGARRADTCKGDSGGPLICQRGGAWKLFGVTSWGDNTFCNPSPTDAVPGVYTRVDRYRSWIKSRVEMDFCPSKR